MKFSAIIIIMCSVLAYDKKVIAVNIVKDLKYIILIEYLIIHVEAQYLHLFRLHRT